MKECERLKKIILLLTFLIPISIGANYQVGHANAVQLLEAAKNRISEKDAEVIALKKVKGKVLGIKLEMDDGREHYEVKIKSSGTIYEVEIDAKSGQVLEVEKEGSHHGGDDDGHHGDDDDHDGDDDHLDD
jgi:hypothetical protein